MSIEPLMFSQKTFIHYIYGTASQNIISFISSYNNLYEELHLSHKKKFFWLLQKSIRTKIKKIKPINFTWLKKTITNLLNSSSIPLPPPMRK